MLLSSVPGDVAQLGERDNRTVEVRGSSPLISTKYYTIKIVKRLKPLDARFLGGQRATIKAHPTTPHRPRPYGGAEKIAVTIALQISNTYGIVKFTNDW